MKRNTVVLGVVLALLALFGWSGWANWEYRRQAAEHVLAQAAKGELVAEAATGETATSPLVSKLAPDFTLEDLQGHKVSLSSYKGKAVLLNFWATWCAPCKLETPWIVELRNQYAPQGFEVLGISTEGEDLTADDKTGLERQRKAVTKFAEEMKVPYPMLLNGDTLSKAYGGLDAMPTSFYVDRNGTVIAVQMGITSKDEMEANIKKALGESK